ncbi:dirigent protein 24-like [Impatiens glandulifera]|uniref:dirigent protein 24-like n=1 Tax=Impatiens glandulifera TaxID=253017 RepID=UPI001FB0E321|nr:dirigent protein 24-like [Impatiens glandulifera]
MATNTSSSITPMGIATNFPIYLFLLLLTIGCTTSTRFLNQVPPQFTFPAVLPATSPDDMSLLPSGQVPAPIVTTPIAEEVVAPSIAPSVAIGTTTPSSPGTTTGGALSFFMHDILGGSRPSGRVVTGIVANSNVNNLPFSKTNNQVFPINGGIPLNTLTGVINNNNMPFLVGLNGQQNVAGANSVIQNTGNNNVASVGNGNLPFVSAGQLPAGLTLQQVMFGSITVVDNELTEGHELDSAVLGKAQGFYLASSLDGTGHTLVLTALFHSGEHHEIEDTISFFGIHRTGSPESQIAVIGGTGKYEHAKGYATITTLHQQDQHTTDGVETITEFTVYLTYVI